MNVNTDIRTIDDINDDIKRKIIEAYSISNFLIRINELRNGNEEYTTLTSSEIVAKLNKNLDMELNCSYNLVLVHIAFNNK